MSYQPPTVLEEKYDFAQIGFTIAPNATPRFVYSLTSLAKKVQLSHRVSPERSREIVFEMVTDIIDKHGDTAPLFVDDAMSRDETQRVIV